MDTNIAWKIYMSTPEAKQQAARMTWQPERDRLFEERVKEDELKADNEAVSRWQTYVGLMLSGKRQTHSGSIIPG